MYSNLNDPNDLYRSLDVPELTTRYYHPISKQRSDCCLLIIQDLDENNMDVKMI